MGRPAEGGGGLGREEEEEVWGGREGGGVLGREVAELSEWFIHEEERVSREDPWQLWRELWALGLA